MRSIPGRALAIAMVSVVISFLGTLWFVHHRLEIIDAKVRDLVTNANPSVENMSAARAELRRLAMHAHAYLEASSRGDRVDRSPIYAAHDRLRDRYRVQLALPRFAGESELTLAVEDAIAPLGGLLDDVLEKVDQRRLAEAHAILTHQFHDAVDRADDAIERLIDFNSARGRERVLAIQEARDSSTLIGWSMSGLSVALAVLATLLAFRALARYGRIVAERDRLLQARATEMESFAYRVAHDLRNPLAGIALRLVAAEGATLGPVEMQALCTRLRGRVKHMSVIIDGLLEFARAGSRAVAGARAEVAHVLDDAVSDVQPGAAAAHIELTIERDGDVGDAACSPGVLTSIVSNLLGNAIKFVSTVERPGRRIVIRASRRGGEVRLEIEDNGPGIERELQQRIFEPFVRATDERVAGIGLGLATVRRLVSAHGGVSGVRSEPGAGASFFVELPRAAESS